MGVGEFPTVKVMQRPQVGEEEEDVNGCPTQGLRVWKKEKVCGEAGGRRAKLGEEQPALGLLKGQSLEAGQCVFADSPTGPLQSPVP